MMRGFLGSTQFSYAATVLVIGAAVYPLLMVALKWLQGEAELSWAVFQSHLWPNTFVFVLLFGALQFGFAYLKYRADRRKGSGSFS